MYSTLSHTFEKLCIFLAFVIRKVVSPLEWALTRRTSKPVISRVQFWRVNPTPASSVTFPSEIRQYNVYVLQKFVKIFGTRTEKVTRDKKMHMPDRELLNLYRQTCTFWYFKVWRHRIGSSGQCCCFSLWGPRSNNEIWTRWSLSKLKWFFPVSDRQAVHIALQFIAHGFEDHTLLFRLRLRCRKEEETKKQYDSDMFYNSQNDLN